MPRPNPNSYPKEESWRFVQRYVPHKELIEFSKSIVQHNGRKIDEVLPEVLSFVELGKTELKDWWLDIWVNILHQMGLGYTWKDGKYLHSTDLCNFLAETEDVSSYYLYWALKFQYPFGFPKQKYYIENSVAVQPIVLILQYLVMLNSLTNRISESYISRDEITKFLMRSKGHERISENSSTILTLRNENYDYSIEEQQKNGFYDAGKHLFQRGRLFIQNIELLKFSDDRIFIQDEDHLLRIKKFLTFVKPPIVFTENSQDMRNQYFSMVYNNLDPYPTSLAEATQGTGTPLRVTSIVPPIWVPHTTSNRNITNPDDTTGEFTHSNTQSRKFQNKLKKDILELYNNKCCICGLDHPAFLRAAHIVPVNVDPSIAADRRNCMLLCVFHDVAFEEGLIVIDDENKVKINEKYRDKLQHPLLCKELVERENQEIQLPYTLVPNPTYLNRHRKLHGVID